MKDEISIEPEQVLHPDSLNDETARTLSLMCDGLFYELGLYLNKLIFVVDAASLRMLSVFD